jgi:hypothetical protein
VSCTFSAAQCYMSWLHLLCVLLGFTSVASGGASASARPCLSPSCGRARIDAIKARKAADQEAEADDGAGSRQARKLSTMRVDPKARQSACCFVAEVDLVKSIGVNAGFIK